MRSGNKRKGPCGETIIVVVVTVSETGFQFVAQDVLVLTM